MQTIKIQGSKISADVEKRAVLIKMKFLIEETKPVLK